MTTVLQEALVSLLEGTFWVLAATLVYVYAGYPVLIALLARLRPRPCSVSPVQPKVSLLIAAFNEAAGIGKTIENKLALRYPRNRLEIIVVSDGSTDGTDDVVRRYAAAGVTLLRQEPRAGKTAALNLAAGQATGEVLVFSDANSLYHPDALAHLVSNFADRGVGYVTGHMAYGDPHGTVIGEGCSSYMGYENRLRLYESRVGSVIGVDGGIDAIRRDLFSPMRPDQLPDLILPLRVIEQGYRVVYEPRAVLYEDTLETTEQEFRMRVRVALRALWALYETRHLLDPRRYGFVSIQILSHKVLRYAAFALLALAFPLNALLLGEGGVYRLAFTLQLAFYGCALAGHLSRRGVRRPALFSLPYYFALVNVATAVAFVRFLRGTRQTLWTPRLG